MGRTIQGTLQTKTDNLSIRIKWFGVLSGVSFNSNQDDCFAFSHATMFAGLFAVDEKLIDLDTAP